MSVTDTPEIAALEPIPLTALPLPAPDGAAVAPVDAMGLIAQAEQLAANGRPQAAVVLYQHGIAGTAAALRHVLLFNMAVLLGQLDRFAEAELAYRQAILSKPDFAQAWFNLGALVERAGRKEHAITIWQSMLDHPLVGPHQQRDLYLMVVNGMGRLLEEMRQFDRAEAKLLASLQTDPHQPHVIQHWVHLRQKQCKWPVYADVPGVSQSAMLTGTSPLAMLSASEDPGRQLAAAVRFVNDKVNLRVPRLAPEKGYHHDKLRIGFLSSDFCLHAVSLLTVQLLELLDREKFEVFGYCWSREDGTALRKRVVAAFDRYVPIVGLSDEDAARAIRNDEIDVLVDLQGITSGAGPNIIAHRPAPMQMTYLGFPGPTGHPCIDYVIADAFLIPQIEAPLYTEKPLYLPHIFQCSDRLRPVGAQPTREQMGLPKDAFVFCCFNNNYKFTEPVFDSWMRILKAVPEGVLWLLADNPWSQANLTDRARELGVDPARLLFAPRVAPDQYLARYTAADLFLDSYPFNAGTTANDALWMGLPVLTRSGRAFASRMAGALLTGLGLPELITYTLEDYEARAIEVATTPALHADLKQRLAHGRDHSAVFDMPRFVNDFSDAVHRVAVRA
jgi:predicted O-linked N-acetylglucosamine transferase (SPINDLY family)